MLQEEVINMLKGAEDAMKHALEHLENELVKVRTGKASPAMLGSIMVNYYGSPAPLGQIANVSVSDSRTLVIQPWEKTMLPPIERAIMEANLGFTPGNDGEVIRINVPPLTEERRKEMVKKAKSLGEDAKVSVRSARHKAMEGFKKLVKDGLPEDTGKKKEIEAQALTDKYIKMVDHMLEVKEKDIMTV